MQLFHLISVNFKQSISSLSVQSRFYSIASDKQSVLCTLKSFWFFLSWTFLTSSAILFSLSSMHFRWPPGYFSWNCGYPSLSKPINTVFLSPSYLSVHSCTPVWNFLLEAKSISFPSSSTSYPSINGS